MQPVEQTYPQQAMQDGSLGWKLFGTRVFLDQFSQWDCDGASTRQYTPYHGRMVSAHPDMRCDLRSIERSLNGTVCYTNGLVRPAAASPGRAPRQPGCPAGGAQGSAQPHRGTAHRSAQQRAPHAPAPAPHGLTRTKARHLTAPVYSQPPNTPALF